MKRIVVYIIAGIIIIGILVAIVLPFLGISLAITGYDGPVARVVDIDHTYDTWHDDSWAEYVNPTEAAVYPTFPDAFDVITPAGLRVEIMAAPNVLSYETIDETTEIVLDADAETNTTKTWEVQKVKCSMSVTIETYSGGLADIKDDVTFWIQVNDNALDSIFSTSDDSFAYIVNIYTRDKAVTEGSMNVVPTAGGYDFELTTVDEEVPPQWMTEGGYTDNLAKFKTVKFPLKVLSAVPLLVPGFPPARVESYTEFDIGIDIILFGYWEQTKDYRDWEWPEYPDFWGDLFAMAIFFGWYIVGFVGSVIIVRFIRDPRGIALLLGILWLIVFWQTGVFAGFLGELGV